MASELTLSTDWLSFIVALFVTLTGALAFYIRQTVKNATISINQLNGGSHLADLPEKVEVLEKKLDVAAAEAAEAKVTGQIVLKNQIEIMAVLMPHKEGNIHE
jgi:hypothetical protein